MRILTNRKMVFATTIFIATIAHVRNIGSESRENTLIHDPPALEKPTQYAFVSHIGGMVGGFSATSDSKYLSRSGHVQASREDTNGVLHSLMTGHADTDDFFKKIANTPDFLKREKFVAEKTDNKLTEYYSPTTSIAYFVKDQKGRIHEYSGETEYAGTGKQLIDAISLLVSRTKLSPADPGLYVRAQRIRTPDLGLIKFDLELERVDLPSIFTLKKIVENEMALVKIQENNQESVLSHNVTIRSGYPLHVRIGRQHYLIFPYRYDPPGKER